MLSAWTGQNTVSQGDNYGAFGDRNRTYKQVWDAGQKIGRWAKRKYDQRKAREVKIEQRRSKKSSIMRMTKSRQKPLSGGDSVSYFTRKSPATSRVVKLAKELPSSYVVNNSSGRAECAVGAQGYFLLGDYFTDTDTNLGHQVLAGNTSGSPQSVKTVFERVHSESMITNQENVNARLVIYDVISRKDTDSIVTDPITAISTGYNDIGSGGASDSVVVGGSPYTIPRFSEYFKVLQQTEVTISPGACHVHKFHYAPNRLISKVLSARIAGSGIGGITIFTIVKFHGTPINDISTQTQVSTAPISLDYVSHEEYVVKAVAIQTANVDINNDLPTAFTVAGNVMQDDGNEQAVNEA